MGFFFYNIKLWSSIGYKRSWLLWPSKYWLQNTILFSIIGWLQYYEWKAKGWIEEKPFEKKKKKKKWFFVRNSFCELGIFFFKNFDQFSKKIGTRRRKMQTFLYKKFMPRNYTSFFCFPKNENKLILSKQWKKLLNLQVLFLNFLLLKKEESDRLKNSRSYLLNEYLIRIMTSNFQFF